MPDTITPRHLTDANADVLTSFYPVPGLGVVPIHAFLLRSKQPVLVDTGPIVYREAYLAALESLIDLDDIRWIYLTHTDADHVGCLRDVLAAAPEAKLVTTFVGLGKLGLHEAVPPERVHLLNPGQRLDIGDRELVAVRPPSFDAPETTGFVDAKTGALYSADCFGAVLPDPVENASELPASTLRACMMLWASIDAPWLSQVQPGPFEASLREVRTLAPPLVLSSHLPPAFGMIDTLLSNLDAARSVRPFVGPDQPALEALLRGEPAATPAPSHDDSAQPRP